jgi:phosphodiesterase/alkaline phosphatase D-like protein
LATFQWSAVTDSSGVTYTLQIATDATFTKLVLEKKGLTSAEYTLTKDEKLSSVSKDTPYYWRVKAIDGASNESAWASAGSFYVGFFFTQTTLIYILIGIGAVILILLAFWLGTRRSSRLE